MQWYAFQCLPLHGKMALLHIHEMKTYFFKFSTSLVLNVRILRAKNIRSTPCVFYVGLTSLNTPTDLTLRVMNDIDSNVVHTIVDQNVKGQFLVFPLFCKTSD